MLIQKINNKIFTNYSSTLIRPKLVQIASNLVVASFELMKIIPAKYAVLKAIDKGLINPNYPIIETSSGTYALGLAIVCAELNIPFFIIGDAVIDESLQNRLKYLGGKVQIISSKDGKQDIQKLRLEYLQEYLQNNKEAFWPAQYYNKDNRLAYTDFADYLIENIGNEFTLVGSVGSGGSTCGTIERLRQTNNDIALVGVDTFGSVLFGLDKKDRKLRGLGNSILPDNLIHEYFDQVHWVTAECAYQNTRELYTNTALFCGPTTGAAYHVAKWASKENPKKMTVLISPDSGYRYTSTVYNDQWLKGNMLDLNAKFLEPKHINNIKNALEPWSYINWNRRTYDEIKNDS
jgi:cysteine synthase